MPVVLRSKVKSETDTIEDEVPRSSRKPVGRRQRKRRREDNEDASDSVVSDEESAHYSRSLGNSRPFEIVADLPCSLESAQYSALTHPLSVKDSAVLYDSLVRSRKTWVHGEMFDLYFTKTAKPPKESTPTKPDGSPKGMIMQVRDKMQKMCDCIMFGGPHTFPIRLFILKNDEIEQKWQEEQDTKKKEKEEKRKREQDEKKRRIEQKKQQQLLRKQEREKMIQLQKENKAKAKMEQEHLKLKRKEELRKEKEENKKVKKNSSGSNRQPHTSLHRVKQNSSNSQSVTDPKMIANLNLMAQRDPKLNSLMASVAKGDATLDQVEEFKKFIEIAKKSPPPPGWNPPLSTKGSQGTTEKVSVNKTVQPTEHTMSSAQPKKLLVEKSSENTEQSNENIAASKEKFNKSNEKIKAFNEKTDESREKINEPKAATDERMETTDELEKKSKKDADIAAERHRVASGNRRRVKKETELDTKPVSTLSPELNEEDKSMQLTAFQQKYVEGAQLILEYQEYTHSRYMLPKNAIIEYVETTGDFIISWIMVHNIKEIARYKSKRLRELCKEFKTEEEIARVKSEFNIYLQKNCPRPLYSPMTVKISGIHRKFVPIVLNSVDSLEKTQKEMESIMDIGTRLSGYNLWYQLDAYDDKMLAENLRVGLNEHEQELKIRKPKK
ncbi:hypothetical protein HG535_0E03060 [Zygotorulaspora mrakii]|uniref:SWR1-complex protein 3 n=1 Tax=Zygotorulaspora mrakii TaxID=42260 RepID=A0A7H9B601_ZYGMR|nr:uncharacterized protein HG535_0E03060 [Zygotorulaspora mrakii]QLG73222.1 hypothetical protein HG535_0E03060 [Zygotorulaspora mrakii]